MPELNVSWPEREERDSAMGRYMDAFSRLETMMQVATLQLLQIDEVRAQPFFAALGTRQLIDVLNAAAKLELSQDGAERVRKLCIQLGNRNMRRNHIVHGRWNVHITPQDDGTGTAEWIRRYDHIDPSFGGDPHDTKLIGMYTFTIPALDKATGHVEEMVQALSSLIQDIPALRPPPPSPEESFRRWVEDRIASGGGVYPQPSQYRFR